MPIVDASDYNVPFLFKNAHVNTMFPAFFRKQVNPFTKRIRIDTPDQDFFDVDTILQGKKKAVFLFHGLEGSSGSQYMKGLGHLLQAEYDIYALNFRSCSGEMNKTKTIYHSGFTQDARLLLNTYASSYDEVNLIGYSLGGNMMLKYLGENPELVPSQVRKAIAVSTPSAMSAGAQLLKKFHNRLYTKNFIKTLMEKVKIKAEQFPGEIDLTPMNKIKQVWDFDEYYTGPMHGFEGAEDYYSKCSSGQFMPEIKIETHIINALDDTFLAANSYPFELAKDSPLIHLHAPKYGGHVGFYQKGNSYWVEDKILSLLKS